MAEIRFHDGGDTLTDAEDIARFLDGHGVLYEAWDISKLDGASRDQGESEQDHILTVFADEIDRLMAERGYQSADVIALSPSTPNLDELLAKFDKEHLHTEDEVRFVVGGSGVFVIRGEDGKLFDVEVHPGDLLAVPEGTQHYFELTDERRIQCIRLFTDKAGWVAHYVDG